MYRSVVLFVALSIWLGVGSLRAQEKAPLAAERSHVIAYEDATLRAVAEHLEQTFGVPIIIDEHDLKDAGLSPELKITFEQKKLTLSAALDQVLHPRELGWRPLAGFGSRKTAYILIAPRDSECPFTITQVYKVRGDVNGKELAKQIEREIAPQSWFTNRGPGGIPAATKSLLVIFNEERVLREIANKFSEQLQAVQGEVNYAPGSIEAKLCAKYTVHWRNKPLKDALEQLQQDQQVKLVWDDAAFTKAHIDQRKPISLTARSISVADILDLSVRQVGGQWRVEEDRLVIGTRESAAENIVSRDYDVRDLLPAFDDDEDELIELITATVTPNAWREGSGPTDEVQFNRPGILTVKINDFVHRELVQFLADLRAAK